MPTPFAFARGPGSHRLDLRRLRVITTDLLVGLVLTALAYAGLMWAVVHGKHVVEQVIRGEYPHHPNPEHRPAGEEDGASLETPTSGSSDDRTGGNGRGGGDVP